MRVSQRLAVLACIAILSGIGCRKLKPFAPPRPLPPGTLMFHFTSKVQGPVDLAIDGTRIPVETAKKKAANLVISGLPIGKHRYFISSPKDAFGPDQGEVDMPADKGMFIVSFAQHFDAVLYGQSEPTPPAEGMPGVKAHLEH